MRALAVIVASWLVTGCGAGAFACENDGECNNSGVAGTCEPGGGCSFPDDRCASGKRYGAHAPDGLGGSCVPEGGSESTDTSVGTTLTSTTTTITTLDSGDPSSSTSPSTTVTTDSDEGSSSADESSTGPIGTTGDVPATFFDPFDREDGTALGNGWIEKTPLVFQIVDQRVVLESANFGNFRNNICYRPTEEALLDVEVTLAFSFTNEMGIAGYPQLHLRVQPDTVVRVGTLDSYAVFIDTADPNSPVLTVNRILGGGFGDVSTMPVELDVAAQYRLRGRVTGTGPVTIEGFLEVDADGQWDVVAETSLVDTSMTMLDGPGTVGLSGHDDISTIALDDFGYTEL